MKNKAMDALIKMNMPANIKGFHYIAEAIRHAFSIVLTKGNLAVVETYLALNCTGNGNLLNTFFLRLSQEG